MKPVEREKVSAASRGRVNGGGGAVSGEVELTEEEWETKIIEDYDAVLIQYTRQELGQAKFDRQKARTRHIAIGKMKDVRAEREYDG
jgi:hypothetical protein